MTLQQSQIDLPRNPPPFFDQRNVIGGIEILFRFLWNTRANRWELGIYDANEQPILRSVKLLPGFPLTYRIRDARFPVGNLFLLGSIPTLETLGDGSCSLLFIEEI